MAEQIDPSEVPVVKEVVVRLSGPHERLRWDELMDRHHLLGFKQFAAAACAMSPSGEASGWRCWAGRPGVPMPPVRAVAGLAQGGAVPALAPDRQQHANS